MSTTPPANGPLAAKGEPDASARCPKRSYIARRCGSERICQLALISLNRTLADSSSGLRSGWCTEASLRKATLISSTVAVRSTPRTS